MKPNESVASTNDIVQSTFEQIACPLDGNSLYATLEAAIQRAYELGTRCASSMHVAVSAHAPQAGAA
jgi:hypothetical protein